MAVSGRAWIAWERNRGCGTTEPGGRYCDDCGALLPTPEEEE